MEFATARQGAGLLNMRESNNSFLVETSYNSDIDMDIRIEIEEKFSKSKTNSQYKFPRIKPELTTRTRFLKHSSSASFKKQVFSHKSSKSLHNPYLSEAKKIGMHTGNAKSFAGQNSTVQNKNNFFNERINSTRHLNKEKNLNSKSPPQKKKDFVKIYSKSPKSQVINFNSKLKFGLQPIKMETPIINRVNTMRIRKLVGESKKFS